LIFHHDNALLYTSRKVQELLEAKHVKLMPHPPYSPDLAPCDFWLFPKLKKKLGGRHFERVENLACAVQAVVDEIPKEEYIECFQSWQKRLKRCIEVNGNYFEGL